MRLIMFSVGGRRGVGSVREDSVVDLRDVAEDMLALIDGGEERLAAARKVHTSTDATTHALSEIAILPPLDPPRGNVLGVGLNYLKHAQEGARKRGEHEVKPPTIFTKASTSLIGPYDDIVADPEVTQKLDWEVELGVVIGRAGTNIKRSEAEAHIFGYTVVNDVTARDVQHGWGGQWFKGKSLDRTSPVGPWVVTRDEIADPQNLELRLSVNGVSKQRANTAEMIYPVVDLIAWLSIGMTIPAGALIASGTPAGVGNARTPPEYLAPGDEVVAEVEGIGRLHNRVVRISERHG